MLYTKYNREERNICTHLFRVLHEAKNEYQILREFIGIDKPIEQFEIFSEVALIRDAFFQRKDKNLSEFMDNLVRLIKDQENIQTCRLFSELPKVLNDIKKTHPKQIRQKASVQNIILSEDESTVYGSLQGMFNAKPDLAIFLKNEIIVYEAKLTLDFEEQQIERTKKIVQVWSKLLFQDLGYTSPPQFYVRKLGLNKYRPDISWENIFKIISKVLPSNDKSYIAIESAIQN